MFSFVYFLVIPHVVYAVVNLTCVNTPRYSIGDAFHVESDVVKKFGFDASCPFSYDVMGRPRSIGHMCTSSNVSYVCSFRMNGIEITSDGKILSSAYGQVLFEDPSMSGAYGAVYSNQIFTEWNDLIKRETKLHKPVFRVQHDLVIPLRMPWDDCFNHVSFQTMPLIGAVFEFHKHHWDSAVWHTSLFSASLLNVMGVPISRLVIEQVVEVKTVLLPWIPHWNPVQLAPIRGISRQVCELLTQRLLDMTFPKSHRPLKELEVFSPSHPDDTAEELIESYKDRSGLRYIVYVTRAGQACRDVYNERSILSMLSEVVDRSKVKVVVVGHATAYKSMQMLQRSWQRYAKIFSRAIMMIGPHGGAWNNLIFTPSDCHYIEFNYLPDVPVHTEGSVMVRSCFLNAAWAKGGSGSYTVVEANNCTSRKNPPHFYQAGWMKMSVREVARAVVLANARIPEGGGVLRPLVNVEDYPHYLQTELDAPYEKTNIKPVNSLKKKRQDGVDSEYRASEPSRDRRYSSSVGVKEGPAGRMRNTGRGRISVD